MKKVIGRLLFVLFLEIFLFNYKFWMTCRYDQEIMQPVVGEGYEKEGELYRCTLDGKNERALTLTFPDVQVKTVKFNLQSADGGSLEVELLADDEANAIPFSLGKRVISSTERSRYTTLHLSGKSTTLQIVPAVREGDGILVESVVINARIPFSFAPLRVLAVWAVWCFAVFIGTPEKKQRPADPFVEGAAGGWPRGELAAASAAAISAVVCMMFSMSQLDLYANEPHHRQYQELARAFARGEFFIDDEPGEALLSMENPYDTYLRSDVLGEAGEDFRWDTAYYKGKYYVYFGVVPALILYVPYYMITGSDLPNPAAIGITAMFFVLGCFLFLLEAVKKWFPKMPCGEFICLFLFLVWSGFVPIMLENATFYVLPVVMGIAFGVWGMYFWFSAERKERLSPLRLAAGSLCMAAVAGCRPQLVLAAFAAPVFFWKHLKKRQKPAIYAAAFVPFLAVAAGLMWYNAARFGSPFDFGANYNLTTNDMTKRGFVAGRTGLGLWAYLFQPFQMSCGFPFLCPVRVTDSAYFGRTISEAMYGGAFWLSPFLCLSVLPLRLKRCFPEKRVRGMCLVWLAAVIAIVVIDTQGAGLLYRYLGDFGWLLAFGAVLTAASVWERLRELSGGLQNRRFFGACYRIFLKGMAGLSVGTVLLLFLQLYLGDVGSEAMYWFAFWM